MHENETVVSDLKFRDLVLTGLTELQTLARANTQQMTDIKATIDSHAIMILSLNEYRARQVSAQEESDKWEKRLKPLYWLLFMIFCALVAATPSALTTAIGHK